MLTAIFVTCFAGLALALGVSIGCLVRFFKDVRDADIERAREDERKRQSALVRKADHPLDS